MTVEAPDTQRDMSVRTRRHSGVGRFRRFWGPAVVAVASFTGMAYVATHNPHLPGGGIGTCPLHAATGYWCPGCGGTRAVYDLAHLDFLGALSMNPLVALAVPFLAVLWVRWVTRLAGRQLKEWPFPGWAGGALGGLILAFLVLRNIPMFAPWLAP